jgi:hypothetical protein
MQNQREFAQRAKRQAPEGKCQACFTDRRSCSGVWPILSEKCAFCAKDMGFCVRQRCTEEEKEQRKVAQSRHWQSAEEKCQACLRYEYRGSGVSPLLEEKCANCAEGELFCIPQTCTKEEINQRKAVQSKRKRAPLIKRATMMAEKKCQACFNNRASCSGASSALEERCVRCEKKKLHCIPRGCTEEVSD